MKRPKYLNDMDTVQDAIEAALGGLYMSDLVKITKLSYAAVQQATVRLRNRGYIRHKWHGRKLHLTSNKERP